MRFTNDGTGHEFIYLSANERTMLGWLRLSLAITAVGFAVIARFSIGGNSGGLENLSKPIGITFLTLSLVTLLYALFKYLKNQRRLAARSPYVRASRLTFTLAGIIGMVISMFFIVALTWEKLKRQQSR